MPIKTTSPSSDIIDRSREPLWARLFLVLMCVFMVYAFASNWLKTKNMWERGILGKASLFFILALIISSMAYALLYEGIISKHYIRLGFFKKKTLYYTDVRELLYDKHGNIIFISKSDITHKAYIHPTKLNDLISAVGAAGVDIVRT